MKTFISSKNTFTVILLCSVVIFLIITLYLGLEKDGIQSPVIIIPLFIIGMFILILTDTKYVLKNGLLLYYSGPFRGKIDIKSIRKIENHSGLCIPIFLKPALDYKGFIITYNLYDDIFISPENASIFLDELLKINSNIEVI